MFLFEELEENKPVENNNSEICIKHIYSELKKINDVTNVSVNSYNDNISASLSIKKSDDVLDNITQGLNNLNQYSY